MKHKKYQLPVVQLASGDSLNLKVHHFVAEKSGKKLYFQANLHGPEVVGIGVLLKLIQLLKEKPIDQGEVKIIISANPIGLNSKISGYQVGYSNLNGVKYSNWNRIFKLKAGDDNSSYGSQIEDKLANLLQSEAANFDVVIDVHSAQNNTELAYCFSNSKELAKNIGTSHMVILEKKFTGCFDEAFVLGNKNDVQAMTLELSGKIFDEDYLNQWASGLHTWIVSLLNGSQPKNSSYPFVWTKKSDKKYFSKTSGLIIPCKQPGDKYKNGETIVKILSLSGKTHPIKAIHDGYIFKFPLAQIVSEGEEIVEVLEGGKYGQ